MSITQPVDHRRALLANALCRFELETWVRRRELFMRHLCLNVTHATPLVGAVVRDGRVDLARMIMAIEPPKDWPRRALPIGGFHNRALGGKHSLFSASGFERRHRSAGVVAEVSGAASGLIGIRVVGDGLELTAAMGELRIETFRRQARVSIPRCIPDAVAAALPGRLIGEIIDHKWLNGVAWPIVEVDTLNARSTLVTIETGRSAWSMAHLRSTRT